MTGPTPDALARGTGAPMADGRVLPVDHHRAYAGAGFVETPG
ncbi:hypothetical protein [Kitasatospora sp. NPDC058218]